ncbi:MAG TPA: TonB-dependent siderophore receptor [Vicinamibacterales bacterium]|jgi:catecholate siderophore receptor|nr:TonB-dependent siderophore receptor [Vicinamibacterales bacterium]
MTMTKRARLAGAALASAAFAARPATAQASERERGPSDRDLPWLMTIARTTRPQFQEGAGLDARRVVFAIPAGPLDDVLRRFEQITGITTTLKRDGLGLIHSPGASGPLTVAQALNAILSGTGTTFQFTAPLAASIDLETQRESVQVTGSLPVVESPKYSLPVHDVPQTIQLIPQDVLNTQAVNTLSDALRNVPGITLQAGEGGGASNTAGDMFNMRGFSAANSLFVDGVRDDGLISRDVFNLEQLEVFMGPTGSDVGRGTAAGYVNMETKTPTAAPASSALFSYGSADQTRMTFDLDQPLSNHDDGGWLDKSAIRINGLWQDSGVPGRDDAHNESRALAPSLALGLGTPTRLTASAEMTRQNNTPDYGVPGAAWTSSPLTPTTVVASKPVAQSNYYGSVGYDYDKGRDDNYTLRIEHDVTPHLTLRNQARYNDTERDAVITSIGNIASVDPSTGLVTVSRQGNWRENRIFSNQASANGRFSWLGVNHGVNAGVEYTSERQFAPTIGGLGTRGPVDLYAPNPHDAVTGYAPAPTGASTDGHTDTLATYVSDAIQLAPRWQLTGGVRAEHFETRYLAVDTTGVPTTNASASGTLFSGKAGLLFKITPAGNVYVSYGTTATPPGTANFTLSAQTNNQNNPDVKPQRSTNYEAGSKWDFRNGRISLNTALFHTINQNVIYTVDATAIPPIYNQDDGQRVNGVTFGVSGRVSDAWQLLASWSYLDAVLDSQSAVNNGKQLTLTPAHSGSLWTTYRLPMRLTIGGGLRFTDAVFINAANTIQSPGYHLVDGLAEYPVNTHLTLRVNMSNVLNTVYIRNVNNNGGRYNPGSPRAALLTTAVTF